MFLHLRLLLLLNVSPLTHFYTYLLLYLYSSGGHWQWHAANTTDLYGPSADGIGEQEVMMLTSDISLTQDPKNAYQKIIQHYAEDAQVDIEISAK
jgi:catalase (peroxidase I)